METGKLKKFAQAARRSLRDQVTAKLALVLGAESAARRERTEAVKKLEEAIKNHGKDQVIERVAYIWFNRFCALRFMDVNRYTRIGVVSPTDGQSQPEILAEAKMGHIDEDLTDQKTRQHILDLLAGKAPSSDPQGEAYRMLLVASCNDWHRAMPFLFQRIDDYTELLMPDGLLSANSILEATREAMTPDACEDVEVIGWLYQFYISEKKDEVFDGLKKNKKITPENIPAATQLFTPHWIVRYLVENSLGRLWLLNRPGSKLAERMDYYIEPEPRMDTDEHGLKDDVTTIRVNPCESVVPISSPEEIKICDPACGSGHMLTYAFDLLYAIYEEEGYEPAEIPEKILTHNLYGVEIDERAGELAAFALTMKARAKQRRFFNKGVRPNICVLESIRFDEGELGAVVSDQLPAVSKETKRPFLHDMQAFEEADNFGSLIRPQMTSDQIAEVERIIADYCKLTTDLFESMTHQKVLQVLRQADYLSPKYHVVIANPPYMGASNANNRLKSWLSSNYQEGKNDLFAAFIDRNRALSLAQGCVAMITMRNWMFISRYEGFRSKLLSRGTVLSMAHLGERAFDSIGGEVVSTTAFVISAQPNQDLPGIYVRLTEGRSENEKSDLLKKAATNPACGYVFRTRIADFHKIPGDPLAYWVPNSLRDVFASHPSFDSVLEAREGLTTGKNDDYVRFSFEVSTSKVCRHAADRQEAADSQCKWFPYNKGGEQRKWYGNDDFVLHWENDGEMLQTRKHPSGDRIWAHNFNLDFIFRPSISWSDITTKGLSARLFPRRYLFDATGLSAFNRKADDWRPYVAAICNSKVGTFVSTLLNPTLHFKSGDFSEMPLVHKERDLVEKQVDIAIKLSTADWHSYETSRIFKGLPLLNPHYSQSSLKATYQKLRAHGREMTLEMQRLEEENNRIFIDAYGLEDELTPEVPLNEITLTCNPYYRYGKEEPRMDTDKHGLEEKEDIICVNPCSSVVQKYYPDGKEEPRMDADEHGLEEKQSTICVNPCESVVQKYYPDGKEEPRMDTDEHRLEEKQSTICVNPCECVVQKYYPDGKEEPRMDTNEHRLEDKQSTICVNPCESVVQKSFPIDPELEERLLADSMRELVSYAVGCMFGRYALDKPGLILADQGETIEDYRRKVLEPQIDTDEHRCKDDANDIGVNLCESVVQNSFEPDKDNVIPILDRDWFTDDISERFRQFLKVAFGVEHYDENLRFVEQSLNIKGKRNYSIRDYFLGEFYTDHVKRYKKRPIYWLFSSPKGSFNALIYMHRYRPDTVSVVLNDYLREFRGKLSTRLDHLRGVEASADATKGEKTKALKEIENLKKIIDELDAWERDVMYPLATKQIAIDLDDGVKVNYPKFGAALKKIPGL